MLINVKGIVIRSVNISECDKLITIFTEEKGVVVAVANGSRTLKSRYLAATQLFCYSNYVLYKKGDKLWVKEVELIESFFDLRYKIERAALATYVCDVINYVAMADVPDIPLLRLTLNTIFAASKEKHSLKKIKAAFELRAAAMLGFSPDIYSCSRCGKEHADFYLDIMNGIITCSDCKNSSVQTLDALNEEYENAYVTKLAFVTDSVKEAMQYIINCPLEKLFSFTLSGEDLEAFCRAAESYLLHQLDRDFVGLEYFRNIDLLKKPI